MNLVIPSNVALWVVDQLRKHGEVRRSTIGIITASLPPSHDASTTPQAPRIQVAQIGNGSPAEQAGLRVDDEIVAFGNTRVVDRDLLEELIQQQEVGSKHRLTFVRDGKTRVVEVVTERAAAAANRVPDDLTHAPDPTEIVYSRDLQIEVAPVAGSEASARSGQGCHHHSRGFVRAQLSRRVARRDGDRPSQSANGRGA
jgi:membrane-associated protease RseP (regulator of RpoE activity)